MGPEHTVTGWEVALALIVAMPSLGAMVVSIINTLRITKAQTAIEDGNKKTEDVHILLNSQLEAWKNQLIKQGELAMEAQKKAFDEAMKLVKSEMMAKSLAEKVMLEKRIAILEATAEMSKITLAAAIAAPAIPPPGSSDDLSVAAQMAVAIAAPAALAAAAVAPQALSTASHPVDRGGD
jgi:hypothetical protein